jgi:hypothetical protein
MSGNFMKKVTVSEAARWVLRRNGRPLHYRELAEFVRPYVRLAGKTPQQTVRSALARDERFKRVAEGVYGLSEWKGYPVARFAKDIAFDILMSRGKPMTAATLGAAILKERHFVGSASDVARSAARNDARFFYDLEDNTVGLADWRG